MASNIDVLVVGGGAAGLAAATELEAQGLTCQIIEAQTRLGGRIHSVVGPDGGIFERGAQMINGDMTDVLAIAAEAGLHCSPVPSTGRDLCVLSDEVLPRNDLILADELETLLLDQIRSWSSPAEITRSLGSVFRWWNTPWDSPGEAWRAIQWAVSRREAPAGSLRAAMDKLLLSDEDDAIALTMICEQFGDMPEELDALALRSGVEAYGSERDDLEFQFPAGMSQIVDRLASTLLRPPVFGTPVTRIVVERDGVRVFGRKQWWNARRVIVACPPPVAQKIDIQTDQACAATGDLRELLSAFRGGNLIKTTLTYDRAFWRLNGLSGAVTFTDPVGLEVLDTSYDIESCARLTAFLGGPEARARAKLSHAERDGLLLEELSRALGPDAAHPMRIEEAIWVDDCWSGGGYHANIRQGGRSDAAAQLAAFNGSLRFASSELDDTFAGYVEGALRSGRRVARSVAADLQEVVR